MKDFRANRPEKVLIERPEHQDLNRYMEKSSALAGIKEPVSQKLFTSGLFFSRLPFGSTYSIWFFRNSSIREDILTFWVVIYKPFSLAKFFFAGYIPPATTKSRLHLECLFLIRNFTGKLQSSDIQTKYFKKHLRAIIV